MKMDQFREAGITYLKSKLLTLNGLLADIDEQGLTSINQVKELISKDAKRMRKMLSEQ